MADGSLSEGLQLRTLIKSSGELELSAGQRVPTPNRAPDDIVVRIEGTPINPSDIGLLFGAADMRTAERKGRVRWYAPRCRKPACGPWPRRVDESMPAGNEGAGTVVAAGSDPAAQALLGKKVAILGGAMYAQYRVVSAASRPALAGRRQRRRRRLLLRQSADRAFDGRVHAAGEPHRHCPHRGGLEPGPDAGQDLPQGRGRSGRSTSCAAPIRPRSSPTWAPSTWSTPPLRISWPS